MKIEAGKFYRTRDGRKVGPMHRDGVGVWVWAAHSVPEWDNYCRNDGTTWMDTEHEWPDDLVAEWSLVEGGRYTIEHDGFTGVKIGEYVTLEGKRGAVLQQDGTCVVHVYGEKWLKPAVQP